MIKAFVFALLIAGAVAQEQSDSKCNCMFQKLPFGKCPEVNGVNSTYLMDVNKRTIFYECNAGVPYEMKCPIGLVFNPNLNVCDYPCQTCEPYGPVGRCRGRDGKFLRYLRDGVNIAVFYVCNMENPVRYNCPEGKIYSTRLKVCVDFL